MEESYGGNINFPMSEAEVPLTYQAAQFFNTSDARMGANGGGLPGFVAVTQDNIAELLRVMANLELEVQRLKNN